jgi:hypothetical protein
MTCHYGHPASASAGLPQDRRLATNIVTALGGDKPPLRLALLGGGATEELPAKFAFRITDPGNREELGCSTATAWPAPPCRR